jgi:hypothetical protein
MPRQRLPFWLFITFPRRDRLERTSGHSSFPLDRICNNLWKQTPRETNEKNMAGTIKKGALVRVIRENLENSLEARASDRRLPNYMFDSKAEVLDIHDEYALVKFYVPTPNVWLRLDQLELT